MTYEEIYTLENAEILAHLKAHKDSPEPRNHAESNAKMKKIKDKYAKLYLTVCTGCDVCCTYHPKGHKH